MGQGTSIRRSSGSDERCGGLANQTISRKGTIEPIRNIEVIERSDMGVVAQRRSWVSVPEARLSLEQLTLANQQRGDTVTEPMERRLVDRRGAAQRPELVRQGVGGHVGFAPRGRSEEPIVDRDRTSLRPARELVVHESHGGRAEGETPSPP